MQETEETQVRSLGQDEPLEEGMTTHSSIVAWRIPWTEQSGGLQSMGSQSRTWLKWLSMHLWCFLREKMKDIFCTILRNTEHLQFSSVAQSWPTLCDSMNHSTPGLLVHHHLREFTQTHVHQVSDAIQPSQPLSSLSPPAPNPSQHQSLFQWVNFLHEVAKVLEFQL